MSCHLKWLTPNNFRFLKGSFVKGKGVHFVLSLSLSYLLSLSLYTCLSAALTLSVYCVCLFVILDPIAWPLLKYTIGSTVNYTLDRAFTIIACQDHDVWNYYTRGAWRFPEKFHIKCHSYFASLMSWRGSRWWFTGSTRKWKWTVPIIRAYHQTNGCI